LGGGDKVIKTSSSRAKGFARQKTGHCRHRTDETTNDNDRPTGDIVGDTNDLDQVMMGDQLTELLHGARENMHRRRKI